MHYIVLTLYPEMFQSFLSIGLLNKAQGKGRIKIEIVNFRKYGIGKHLSVDAPPYGGGAGMLLRVEPVFRSLRECEQNNPGRRLHKILISPQGKTFSQSKARELAGTTNPVVLICGRFEGFDERIRDLVDDEISLGDFIMMGGEVGAMAIIESVSRLIPGVVGNADSIKHESYCNDLLEYSQYTRPIEFKGRRVPEILVSGNHQKIEDWRKENSLEKTRIKRQDLYQRFLEATRNS